MTETQYLTSDNPSDLVTFLGERITDEQRRFFVEACRSSVGSPWSFRKEDLRWTELVYEWVTRAIDNGDISASLAADILRDIVGNPFRPMAFHHVDEGEYLIKHPEDGRLVLSTLRDPDFPKFADHEPVYGDIDRIASPAVIRVKGTPVAVLDPAWLTWNDAAIPLMVDAMMNEECSSCSEWYVVFLKHKIEGRLHGCKVCLDTRRIPRAEPRWEMMPIIADALEDGAGCREHCILEHLRSERRHWKGCHVIELLRGI